MIAWMRRHWRWLVPTGVALGAVGIWLFFFWFGFHTLFFDETVDEAAPTFSTTTTVAPATTVGTMPSNPSEGTTGMENVEETTTTTTQPSGPVVVASGTFIDRSHPTSGMALVISDGGTQRVLRLEGFETDNGPDLFVYLSTAPADAPAGDFDEDFVDLGVLKGNVGDQNYEIPEGVDLDRYSTVVIWCKRFTVVFGAAELEG